MSERRKRHTRMPSCCRKKISLQIPHLHHTLRRVSLCAFQKGSFTVETAVVLPFMLCAVAALLFLFILTASRAKDYRSLMEKAQTLAVTLGQAYEEDPYVKLYDPSPVSLPFEGWFPKQKWSVQTVAVRAWTGYTGESFCKGDEEAVVYMTPEGEVCHRSSACHYLQLSIQTAAYEALDKARNQSGERYSACEYCIGKRWTGALVYITDYGSSYHSKRDCQGLKRTIMAVPWSEVKGIRMCSKCGGV